jgi:protein subunit release factor B
MRKYIIAFRTPFCLQNKRRQNKDNFPVFLSSTNLRCLQQERKTKFVNKLQHNAMQINPFSSMVVYVCKTKYNPTKGERQNSNTNNSKKAY